MPLFRRYPDEITAAKVSIVPPSAGADALVVRDYADTEDRLILTENREIHFKVPMIRQHPTVDSRLQLIRKVEPYDGLHLEMGWLFSAGIRTKEFRSDAPNMIFQTRGAYATDAILFRSYDGTAYVDCARLAGGYLEIGRGKLTGDLIPDADAARDIGIAGLGFNIIRVRRLSSTGVYLYTDKDINPVPAYDNARNLGRDIERWCRIWFGTELIGKSDDATDVETLKDSPSATFRGAYWDAVAAASVDRDASILHRMLSTTPTSEIAFQIAGADVGKFRDDGAFVLKRVDVADYGGDFVNYTPPAGEEGAMVVAVDTNVTAPGQRLYIYANGAWRYTPLT